MKYDADGRRTLEQMQARAAGKLAEIHQLIAPGLTAPFTFEQLHRLAEDRMAGLPPAEREILRRKAMVAYSELERLIEEMSRHLAAIGDELRKVSHHNRAAAAYGQAPRSRPHPEFGL